MTRRRVALPRLRLIDGVIVAAVALLGLKVLGLFAIDGDATPIARRTAADDLPAFGRVVANARSNYSPADPTTTGSVTAKPKEEPAPVKEAPREVVQAPPLIPPSASEQALLGRLGDRREELQQRAREVEQREKLIQEQERKLDERLGQAKAAEETQKSAAQKPEETAGGLRNLVTMYETMKPKEAARVFDRLPVEILLSVTAQMNARKMSEILAAMSPESAEKLTVAMAKRAKGPAERVSTAGAGLPPGELPAIEPAAPRR